MREDEGLNTRRSILEQFDQFVSFRGSFDVSSSNSRDTAASRTRRSGSDTSFGTDYSFRRERVITNWTTSIRFDGVFNAA